MLSVSKLGAGQEGYYLDSVAQGVEDYYLGHGETPGRWMGSASSLLGLEGEVDAPELLIVQAAQLGFFLCGNRIETASPQSFGDCGREHLVEEQLHPYRR